MFDYGSNGTLRQEDGSIKSGITYLILEYCHNGSLFDILKSNLPGWQIRRYLMQLCLAIQYLHENKIAHRDLKPENVLIDAHNNIKLGDFGFAVSENSQNLKEFVGTKTFIAPEIYEGKIYNGLKADIFAFGVIIFMFFVGNCPFEQATPDNYYYNMIVKHNYEKYWLKTNSDRMNDHFKDLMINLLNYEYEKRPSVNQIISHCFWRTL